MSRELPEAGITPVIFSPFFALPNLSQQVHDLAPCGKPHQFSHSPMGNIAPHSLASGLTSGHIPVTGGPAGAGLDISA